MIETVTVDQVVLCLQEYCSGLKGDLFSLRDIFVKYIKNDDNYKKEWADYLGIRGLNILCMSKTEDNFYYIMTFLLHATKKKEIYKALIQYCMLDESISKETKYYLYYQLVGYNFLNPEVPDNEIGDLMDDLYSQIYQGYKKEFSDMMYIPKEKRNRNFVIAFISQVLEIEHGPTKTLLDRCYILEKYLRKKVFIVNTAEYLTWYRSIPCFSAMSGNYKEEYNQTDNLIWRDKKLAFMQCPPEMPDVAIIKEILDVVKSEKPWFVLNIGGNSIVSDLCSNTVPTLTVATVFSGRTTTRGQFQIIGRKITDADRKWLSKHHMKDSAMIESLFTFSFKQQTHHFTRKELGLPENRFIAILIGGRLDQEIDSECMALLEKLIAAGIFIAFMGKFDQYKEYTDKNSLFGENTAYLGFQDDALAVDEVCDLYINPKRIGGGGSAAEAMYKGLPVVTFDFGDVGLGAGADFHVKDYDDMYNQILRYATDKDYYAEMSQKAKQRAAQLTDSKTEFMRVVHVMEQSEEFK